MVVYMGYSENLGGFNGVPVATFAIQYIHYHYCHCHYGCVAFRVVYCVLSQTGIATSISFFYR